MTKVLNEHPTELLAHATALYQRWRLSEAELILRDICDVAGKHQVGALNLEADIQWSLSNRERAVAATKAVLEMDPLNIKSIKRAQWLGATAGLPAFDADWAENMLNSEDKPQTVYPALIRVLNEIGQHRLALSIAGRGLSVLRKLKADRRVVNKLRMEVAIAREGVGDTKGALEAFRSIDRDLPTAVSAVANEARILHELGHFKEAEELLPAPKEGAPKFNNVKYHILLSTGRMQQAFELYKSRRESAVFTTLVPGYSQPDMQDAELKTKNALLLAEGGPGDELRMSGLYGDYLQIFGNLSIACDPRLQTLLSRTYPEVRFIPSSRSRDELRKLDYVERDRVHDLLGAKLLTNTLIDEAAKAELTLSVFDGLSQLRPSRAAFRSPNRRDLVPMPSLAIEVESWFDNETKPRRIGLSWRSLIVNTTRNKHYLSVEDLRPLAEVPNTEFWILQPGATEQEIVLLSGFLKIRTAPSVDMVDDFESQAALISRLDAVIAPCTTTVELAGALGTPTYILANSNMTKWRLNPNGSDVWHPKASLIIGERIGDIPSMMKRLGSALNGEPSHPSPPKPSVTPERNRNDLKKLTKKLLRTTWFAVKGLVRPETESLRREKNDSVSRNLLRQKDVTGEHIKLAQQQHKNDPSGTHHAIKSVLQFRAGRYADAVKTGQELGEPKGVRDFALNAMRNDMADIGRHDYAIEGLRALLGPTLNDNAQIRLGNAAFERDAYEYLAAIEQPREPKGYVIIFGLNNRVLLGLMTPLAIKLALQGYQVCATTASAMPSSSLPELDGISASIRWSGMSLTDEPFHFRSLRNQWHVDLESRVIECDGINYFTFFAERLSKLSNRYEIDVTSPKVIKDFESLLQRSDVALTVCKRTLHLSKRGLPIRLAAMDTHFAPAGIVRQWCEEVGVDHNINLVGLSISYENYYSNLSTLEAKTISVENMTARPDLRHPLFGGRARFEKYLKENPPTNETKNTVLSYIRMDRSKVEHSDPVERQRVLSAVSATKNSGRKVFAAFGKVLIDFAAPYDRGRTFSGFSEWVNFLVETASQTENLLIIKPHPHERRTEIAASGVQTLRDILPKNLPGNVIFLDHASFNSFELAALVDATFVWNGTAYAEFPVLGAPVVAESIWAERDYPIDGIKLVGRKNYVSVLRGEKQLAVSAETSTRATAYMLFMKSADVAIPFGYVRRAGTNQSIGASTFLNDDMQRLSEGEADPNLALAASRFFEQGTSC